MLRRQFVKNAVLVGAAASIPRVAQAMVGRKEPSAEISAASRPNIVFLFSDQQRPDTMGCYGQQLDVTPYLDKLAAEGVKFDRAYTCQPVCTPARAALQTGQWASQTGCYRNGRALPEDAKTLGKYMRDAGYHTGYVGKWHLASKPRTGNPDDSEAVAAANRGGYEFWRASDALEFTSHGYGGHVYDEQCRKVEFPEGRYRADALGDYAIEFLQKQNRETPFFLFVSWIEPHHQNDRHCYEGPTGSKERFANFTLPADLEGKGGNAKKEYPDYLGCCRSIDDNAERIVAELERRGLLENTLIVYTTDHGCHFCTRNSEYKRSCHDSSTRIPMILRGPGFAGGQAVSEMVSLLDLPPTLLTAAGIPCPPQFVGKALQPLATGATVPWRNMVYAEISESCVGRMLASKRWKYCVLGNFPNDETKLAWNKKPGWAHSSADSFTEAFLYDLEADPAEQNNLVADPATAAVRADFAHHMKQAILEVEGKSVEIKYSI